jgi:hypothetical protein
MLTKQARYFFDYEAVKVPSAGQNNHDLTGPSYEVPGQTKQTGSRGTEKQLPAMRAWRNTDLWFQSIDAPHGLCGVGDELVGLDVNPEAMKEAHFATFPEALVEPCILAGTSAKGYCPACGEPWVRVVERSSMVIERTHNHPTELRTRTSGKMIKPPTSQTTGWRPTCQCGIEETRPGIVLDPFGGSGTVGVVVARLKRDYVLIELSETYANDIARPRLAAVEVGVPVAEQRAGQMGLFEDS